MRVAVVVSGRSYHVAADLPSEIELPEDSKLSTALAQLAANLPEKSSLPASCLVAVGSRHVGTLGNYSDVTLNDGDELVIVAPVSGG